ncbi:G-protein coupled peptide receptor [Fragilaria crotonensis]|nr:G-protein coupled peptide receptor [Fragilaria crotonensis]
MIYTDDGIFCGPDDAEIAVCLKDLSSRFDITDEGDIDEYLGVKVTREDDGTITLTQPHLIDSIIADLGFRENTKTKSTPAPSTASINRDLDGEAHNESWEYRSVIGKLNFLEKSTRPDIAFAVHQCARYSSNPKESHSAAVRYIVRYLMATRDKELFSGLPITALNATWMQTFKAGGTYAQQLKTRQQRNPGQHTSLCTASAQSFGHQRCRRTLHCQRQRVNTPLYRKQREKFCG